MSAVDEIAAYLAHLKTSGNRIDQIIFDELPNGEGMTATDELRRLLDERGVEYRQTEWIDGITVIWRGSDGSKYGARNGLSFDGPTGMLVLFCLTPEQAVDATLGRGTCEADETDTIKCWVKCKDKPSTEHMHLIHVMECSACGGTYEHVNGGYEFCPRCGRKVVGA